MSLGHPSADAAVGSAGTTSATCPNCGSPAAGAFCPDCGQEQRNLIPTVRHWLRSTLEETLSIDGRLPRTLGALALKPGSLTVAWREGRRARFVRPVRLYLIVAALFFALVEADPSAAEGALAGLASSPVSEGGPATDPATIAAVEWMARNADLYGPTVMVPIGALLLYALFRHRRRRYVEHLVFSVHAHTFYLLLIILLMPLWVPLKQLVGVTGAVAVLMISATAYLGSALRRVYDLGIPGTLAVTATLATGYGLAFTMALTLIGTLVYLVVGGGAL